MSGRGGSVCPAGFLPKECLPRGVTAQRVPGGLPGKCLPVGVCPGGSLPDTITPTPCEQNDRQV